MVPGCVSLYRVKKVRNKTVEGWKVQLICRMVLNNQLFAFLHSHKLVIKDKAVAAKDNQAIKDNKKVTRGKAASQYRLVQADLKGSKVAVKTKVVCQHFRVYLDQGEVRNNKKAARGKAASRYRLDQVDLKGNKVAVRNKAVHLCFRAYSDPVEGKDNKMAVENRAAHLSHRTCMTIPKQLFPIICGPRLDMDITGNALPKLKIL